MAFMTRNGAKAAEAAAEAAEAQAIAALAGQRRAADEVAQEARRAAAAGWLTYEIMLTVQEHVTVVDGTAVTGDEISNGPIVDAIEAAGWVLDYVGHTFVQTAQIAPDELAPGQQVGVAGKVVGVYLFRRAVEDAA